MGVPASSFGQVGEANPLQYAAIADKYNAYLKTARGYADALKAGCSLYADGVQTLQHLYEIQRAINANPVGIGATLAMNDLYLETATEFIKTYRLLKVSVAKGGTDNMLTGAERTEMLWQLSDELARLNAKLRTLAISIAYHNLTDVWNQYTAGMVDKSTVVCAAEIGGGYRPGTCGCHRISL